ncbi:MAG: enoyl-CoA hydratase-related protein [Thiobacillaceae bacterium]
MRRLTRVRILLLTHSFNSLTQRLYVELAEAGHELSVEYDIDAAVTREAVALYRPDLVLAPYLRRAIPAEVWRALPCLIVHPGPRGDRGPAALDHAILAGESQWGVTVLQAEAELDAGPVWATATFPMRVATKSSLYRHEVTEAAVRAVFAALARYPDWRAGRWRPERVPLKPLRPAIDPKERVIDWARDDTATALRKAASADGSPGVVDRLFDHPCRLFNLKPYPADGPPGALLGRAGEAIVRATADGAVQIGHLRRLDAEVDFKLPATFALPEAAELPELPEAAADIRYEESAGVGHLYFEFYNGAMGTAACARLTAAYRQALARPTRVIVLHGGPDFFSNGLDLNLIEAAASPADESWRNIEAMDDLCEAILRTDDRLTVAALAGNAGAGGAFLALAADLVWARSGVVLNPHYRNMGNLFGSEFWTYTLPRRLGETAARQLMQSRLPLGTATALRLGLIDAHFGSDVVSFHAETHQRAAELARAADYPARLAEKRARRAADEMAKPLAAYRAEELAEMRRSFYGFDVSYHVARQRFVRKTPHAWTPRHLARHRAPAWDVPPGDEAG